MCQGNVPGGTALWGLWSGTNILLAPWLGCQWESPISHLCQMGASGNLCTAVHVSIDETLKPQGLWPQMSHPTHPLALQGSQGRQRAVDTDLWNLGVLTCGKCHVCRFSRNTFLENFKLEWPNPFRLCLTLWRGDLPKVILECSDV